MKNNNSEKKNIKHIIWDWNGTLLNDSLICVEVMNKMLKERKLPETDICGFAAAMEFPIFMLFKNLGIDLDDEKFENVIEQFLDGYEEKVVEAVVRPELLEIIEKLYNKGVSMSIVSASHNEYLQRTIKRHGLNKYFREISGLPDKNGVSKVEIGKKQIEKLKINRDKCIMIGDTVHDYEVASELGVECWLFPSGHSIYENLTKTDGRIFRDSFTLAEALSKLFAHSS